MLAFEVHLLEIYTVFMCLEEKRTRKIKDLLSQLFIFMNQSF